jgi:twitching motility two-component system response regulator PilH
MARVLIVEDDPLMLRMYQKIFTFAQHEVFVASNGVEGVEKARAEKPTVIVMDVMMPKMDGLAALETLKADPNTKTIPVIMLTNLASEKDAENAMLKGAIKYIVKSEHDPKEVEAMVREIIAANTRDQVPTAA